MRENVSGGALEAAVRPDDQASATGLSGRDGALACAGLLMRNGRPAYAMIIRLERLVAINARFGPETGDQILTVFSQVLAQKLLAADQLFQWRGPCFVAVVERAWSIEAVRAEAARLAKMRFEHSVETGDRSVLLTLSASSGAIPLLNDSDLAMFAARVETFASDRFAAESRSKAAGE